MENPEHLIEEIHIIRGKPDSNTIWVTSNTNKIGTESSFENIKEEGYQFLIALAEFLGYEPAIILNIDEIK